MSTTPPEKKQTISVGNVGLQLRTLDEVWRFATCLANSGLAPKGFESPEAITIALQLGFELGLPPMAAMQNISVINGRPSIWGDTQLAIVRSTGQLADFDECECNAEVDALFRRKCLSDNAEVRKRLAMEIAVAQATMKRSADDFGVTVFVCRKGEEPVFSRFTVADAKTAGLWDKRGSNGQATPWVTFPARMLKFRARSFGLRDKFGDALRGLLTTEEALDSRDEKQVAGREIPAARPQLFSGAPAQVADFPSVAPSPETAPETEPAEAPAAAAPPPEKPKRARKQQPKDEEEATLVLEAPAPAQTAVARLEQEIAAARLDRFKVAEWFQAQDLDYSSLDEFDAKTALSVFDKLREACQP